MQKLLLFGLTMLAGCSRAVVPPGADLARTIAGRVAGPAQSCVSTQSASNLRAIDPATLGYGSGSTVYINQLGGPCPGLRELSTVIVEVQGGRYCRGDHFRAVELTGGIPGPVCILGDWVPYRKP